MILTPTAKIIKDYIKSFSGCPLIERIRAEEANYKYYDKLSFTLWSLLNDTPYTRGEIDLAGWNSQAVNEASYKKNN